MGSSAGWSVTTRPWRFTGGDDGDEEAKREHLRQPQRQALARAAMAEWDAWLANPDPHHTPEPVWVRMSRGEESR